MENQNQEENQNEKTKKRRNEKIFGTVLISSISLASLLFGFSRSFKAGIKTNQKGNSKESMILSQEANLLALKALKVGTFYAVSGFSLFCFSVWTFLGAKDLQDFRLKVGSFLPKLTPNQDQSQGRKDFSGLTDLIEYLISEDKKKK